MEQNKKGLLWLTNKVWLVRLHNQSVSGTSLGTPKRTRQKRSLDSPPLGLQEEKLRPGQVVWLVQEPAHLGPDGSITTKSDKLNNMEVGESSFLPRSLIIRMVDSNQFPLLQQPLTLRVDNLKPQLTPPQSVSVLKRTTLGVGVGGEVYFLTH